MPKKKSTTINENAVALSRSHRKMDHRNFPFPVNCTLFRPNITRSAPQLVMHNLFGSTICQLIKLPTFKITKSWRRNPRRNNSTMSGDPKNLNIHTTKLSFNQQFMSSFCQKRGETRCSFNNPNCFLAVRQHNESFGATWLSNTSQNSCKQNEESLNFTSKWRLIFTSKRASKTMSSTLNHNWPGTNIMLGRTISCNMHELFLMTNAKKWITQCIKNMFVPHWRRCRHFGDTACSGLWASRGRWTDLQDGTDNVGGRIGHLIVYSEGWPFQMPINSEVNHSKHNKTRISE